MEQVKFRERFEPRTIYLRSNNTQHCMSVSECCGKTVRSWVSGHSWDTHLWQFKEYTEISEHDYNEWLWVRKHQYRIGCCVQGCKDPAVVRAVAKLVNYVEVQS
jgi:hypothetical protein